MPDAILPVRRSAAALPCLPLLLAACVNAARAPSGRAAGSADPVRHPSMKIRVRPSRPTCWTPTCAAWKEIALMDASGSHFIPLSKYDEQGLQVAATAACRCRITAGCGKVNGDSTRT